MQNIPESIPLAVPTSASWTASIAASAMLCLESFGTGGDINCRLTLADNELSLTTRGVRRRLPSTSVHSHQLTTIQLVTTKYNALHCSYINGKRNQGRQPKKWMDNANEDIEAKTLTVQQAMVLVWDRNKWKHQVADSSSLKWWKRAEEE